MDIAVVVASTNRSEEISQLLLRLEAQTLPPKSVVLSVVNRSDLPADLPAHIHVVMGPAGLTKQRNRGLELVLGTSDVIVYFDDDFLPAENALAGIKELFATQREVVSATGLVLQDGVKIGGISYSEAMETLLAYESHPAGPIENKEILWAYGCNMAFRSAAIDDLRFDENLPLHGWQEDMDFAARLSARGKVIKTSAFAGVHRGVNKGRSPGFALGFSQIVNPIYLVRKGAMRPEKAATLIFRNFSANHLKVFRPEPFIDRLGRVCGNWRGIFHILGGRADPTTILRFKQ